MSARDDLLFLPSTKSHSRLVHCSSSRFRPRQVFECPLHGRSRTRMPSPHELLHRVHDVHEAQPHRISSEPSIQDVAHLNIFTMFITTKYRRRTTTFIHPVLFWRSKTDLTPITVLISIATTFLDSRSAHRTPTACQCIARH